MMLETETNPKPCVVLLSGGLDSATTLAIAAQGGFTCHTLAFDYGQRHRHELDAAARVARSFNVASHRVVRIGGLAVDGGSGGSAAASVFGGSALTSDIEVPKDRDQKQMSQDIPVTYVPARNLVFLALATALAESLGASDVFIGVNAVDYSGYPDCRPEFIRSFEHTGVLATKAGAEGGSLRVHAPLVNLSKSEIITLGTRLGVDYALTHSCYDPVVSVGAVMACGRCDSCQLRREGFASAGVCDPTAYARREGDC